MKIKNLREYDVNIAPRYTDEGIEVAAGATVDVDEQLGGELCEQVDNWQRVTPPAATRTSKQKGA